MYFTPVFTPVLRFVLLMNYFSSTSALLLQLVVKLLCYLNGARILVQYELLHSSKGLLSAFNKTAILSNLWKQGWLALKAACSHGWVIK